MIETKCKHEVYEAKSKSTQNIYISLVWTSLSQYFIAFKNSGVEKPVAVTRATVTKQFSVSAAVMDQIAAVALQCCCVDFKRSPKVGLFKVGYIFLMKITIV